MHDMVLLRVSVAVGYNNKIYNMCRSCWFRIRNCVRTPISCGGGGDCLFRYVYLEFRYMLPKALFGIREDDGGGNDEYYIMHICSVSRSSTSPRSLTHTHIYIYRRACVVASHLSSDRDLVQGTIHPSICTPRACVQPCSSLRSCYDRRAPEPHNIHVCGSLQAIAVYCP